MEAIEVEGTREACTVGVDLLSEGGITSILYIQS